MRMRTEDEERSEGVVHRTRGMMLVGGDADTAEPADECAREREAVQAATLLAEHEANDLVTHEGHAQEGVERDVDAERAEVGGGLDVDGSREEIPLLPEDGAARHTRRYPKGRHEGEQREHHRHGQQQYGRRQLRVRNPVAQVPLASLREAA